MGFGLHSSARYLLWLRMYPWLFMLMWRRHNSLPTLTLDPIRPFHHAFMSQVPGRVSDKHFIVGARTCPQRFRTQRFRTSQRDQFWLYGRNLAAIDRGVPIDVVRYTRRCDSWLVFNRFDNGCPLRSVALSMSSTSFA